MLQVPSRLHLDLFARAKVVDLIDRTDRPPVVLYPLIVILDRITMVTNLHSVVLDHLMMTMNRLAMFVECNTILLKSPPTQDISEKIEGTGTRVTYQVATLLQKRIRDKRKRDSRKRDFGSSLAMVALARGMLARLRFLDALYI